MIVLDASALIDVVLDQSTKEGVLAHLGQPILAPAHQPAEILSAIARLVRAGGLTARTARRALDDAMALQQEFITLDGPLLRRAFALDGRIRALDGLYVALAESRGCPLVTTDARLARSGPPCEVVLVE